jgi:PiT family inorganic phosphate transporter
MLIALFVAALVWNIGTWWLGLPNSSSHCLIGALIGVALGNAAARSRSLTDGVHWHQLWSVLKALALSPLLGFVLAGALYLVISKTIHDKHLYEPAKDRPPVWWMRGILILTCAGVSFAHGTNDGQKSIGLIMLTIIGLFPATYALNPQAGQSLADLPHVMREAEPLVAKYGDDEKAAALAAARSIERGAIAARSANASKAGGAARTTNADGAASANGTGDPGVRDPTSADAAQATLAALDLDQPHGLELGPNAPAAKQRASVRDDVYRVISQLKHVEEVRSASKEEQQRATKLAKQLGQSVEYAPNWVRLLSALCLGVGTIIGYRRIVTTLGERLGNVHLTPAQGAAAEVVSTVLIGTAGFTGLPVSTTHIVTSGIGGTMVTAGAGLRYQMLRRIVSAWLLTLPVTIITAGVLYYLLANPRL